MEIDRPASPPRLRFSQRMQQDRGQDSRMDGQQGCESCRKWQEHYYWEHMDGSKMRFFRLMTGDFARGISIPDKFVKNFDGTKSFELKVPSGETWNVSADKHANELFLVSGWEEFAKAHGLQENDLLIFTCNGNSSFDVLIFEANGGEKVSSLFGNRTGGPNMRKCFDDMAGRGKQAQRYSMSDSDQNTTTPSQSQLAGCPHYASTSNKSAGRNGRQLPGTPNSSSDHVKREATGEEDSDEELANYNNYYYYSRMANRLSEEEKEEIISMASIQPGNPAFVTVLQKSHVRHRSNFLIFPGQFAADHLDSRLPEITLIRPNRKGKWCVKYYCTRDTRGIRNYSLHKFVQENGLREGDVCAFELMKGARRVTMAVHAVRKVHGRFVLVG